MQRIGEALTKMQHQFGGPKMMLLFNRSGAPERWGWSIRYPWLVAFRLFFALHS